ncbi:hypothetical protein V1264_013414 [Littorina saxatilis]|uniref:Uncharacterized protein n=1 Tax=Littorina saxatilis TaxID=31220 RepID=A0AAN9BQ87_9CAEN
MAEFNEGEKDMILLGVLASTPMTEGDVDRLIPSRKSTRKQKRTAYLIDSKAVCRQMFKQYLNQQILCVPDPERSVQLV